MTATAGNGKLRPRPRLFSDATVGGVAIGLTVLIWAGFALSMRAAGSSALLAADVALIRFGLPALLLVPFLPSRIGRLVHVRPQDAVMIMAGGGLPFFLLAAQGARDGSAAHVGAVIAGAAPLFVALFARLLDGRSIGGARLGALALILAGVALLAAPAASGTADPARAVLWLLAAAGLWAAYTLGLRRAGLDAIGCTLLLCLPSAVATVGLVFAGILPTGLGAFTLADALPFVLVQGLGVGVLGALAYATAVRLLGAGRSAAVGALAPAVTAVLAVPLLHEPLDLPVGIGVAVIVAGVVLVGRRSGGETCSRP